MVKQERLLLCGNVDCSLWFVGISKKGHWHISVFTDRICLFRLWRIADSFLSGLSGNDGPIYLPGALCWKIPAKIGPVKQKGGVKSDETN